MYKSLICGGNSNVELDYGKLVHYINFNNAGTTPLLRVSSKRLMIFLVSIPQ